VVQRNAMKVWEQGGEFKTVLSQDADIQRLLSREELDRAFDARHHFNHTDGIFEGFSERDEMKRDQKPNPNLKDLLRLKGPRIREARSPP